ncbi:F-box only protein 5-like [Watersipora subatra]|uniref:F-box only protein 5-like n=1 Tax=Watersipora subatra TaxID=2589382 RepID=UPI00355AF1AD
MSSDNLHSSNDDKIRTVDSTPVAKLTKSFQAIEDTSTPLLPRSRSETKCSLTQDSGFSELSSSILSQNEDASSNCINDPLLIKPPDNHPTKSLPKADAQTESLEQMLSYIENLKKQCPPEKLIGRRIGEEFLDLIKELDDQQIPAISNIFSFLSDKDLVRCKNVSKSWWLVLQKDNKTSARLANLKEQENDFLTKEFRSGSNSATSAPLATIQINKNISPRSSCSSSSPEDWSENIQFKRYTKAAKKLNTGQQFVKCPRCIGPAKLYKEARKAMCTSKVCKYVFCTLCDLKFHGAESCLSHPSPRKRTTAKEKSINSKASKKLLRRL